MNMALLALAAILAIDSLLVLWWIHVTERDNDKKRKRCRTASSEGCTERYRAVLRESFNSLQTVRWLNP